MQRRTKKLLIVFVLGPAVLVGLGAAALAVRQYQVAQTTRRSYAEGQAAFQAGDYPKALPLIARYVGRNQTDTDALLMLSECRARVPKPEGSEIVEAARYAEAALAVDRANQRALELLIDYYSRVNFFTELNRVCDELLALKVDHAGALMSKTRALLALGRYDDARALVDRLTALDPSDSERFRLVLEIRRLQGATPEQIASEAGELARKFPDSLEIQVIHAQTLLGAGDVSSATATAERAALLKPATLRGVADFLRLTDLASILIRVGGSSSAKANQEHLRDLGRAIIETGMNDPGLGQGVAAIAAGWEWRGARLSAAQSWVDRGLESGSTGPSAALLAWKAMLARDQGKEWQTVAQQVRATERMPPFIWSALLDAIAEIEHGQWPKAAQGLSSIGVHAQQIVGSSRDQGEPASDQRSVEAFDALVLASFYRGIVDHSQGEWRLAVDNWNAAGDAEPAWSLPRVKVAEALLRRGQSNAAFDAAMQAFRIRNGALEGLTLAKALVARDEAAGPRKELSSLLATILTDLEAIDVLRGEALCLRGRAAATRKDQSSVLAVVKEVAGMDPPPDTGLMLGLARSIRAAGLDGWDDVLAAAERGGASESIIMQAADAAAAGRRDEALSILRRAAAERQGIASLPLRLQEARVLAEGGFLQEARDLLRAISTEHAAVASAQLDVLDQPLAWTEASLVEAVVQRLRNASGERGIEWKLADATRLLTFSPDPAKAQEVIVRLTAIVREDPQNSQALALLGEWMLVLKDEPEAIKYFTRAIEVPDAPPALYPRLINLLIRSTRTDDARARLGQFAELDRLSPELRRARVGLFMDLGLTAQAQNDLRALSDQGTVRDRLNYAQSLLAQARPADALPLIDEVLATPDLTRDQFMNAAGLLVDAGQSDRALMLLEQRGHQTSGSSAIRLDQGRLLERAGRIDEAETVLLAVAESAENSEPILELARFYIRRSKQDQAREVIKAAKARGLNAQELESLDALAAAATQPLTEAQQQSVIESIPPGPTRDLAEATRWFDAHPNEQQEFITRLRKITAAEPRQLLAWRFLINTLIQVGDVPGAVSAARSASAAIPLSIETARMEANVLLLAGRPKEARSAAERWKSMEKDPFDPLICLANVEISDGQPDAAFAALEPLWTHAADLAPKVTQQHWLSLIACYAMIEKTDRARSLVSMKDAAESGYLDAVAAIAGEHARPIDEARKWLESLRPALSSPPERSIGLAGAFASLAFRSRAEQDCGSALELLEPRLASPESSVGDFLLAASLLEMQNRSAEAESVYRRAIDKDPISWIATNNLAYLLVQRAAPGDEPLSLARRARELAEKAAASAAARSSVLQTLALALLRSGQAPEALATIRQALALDASSTEARLTEAEALEATGDKARALALINALLKEAEAGSTLIREADRARASAMVDRLNH